MARHDDDDDDDDAANVSSMQNFFKDSAMQFHLLTNKSSALKSKVTD